MSAENQAERYHEDQQRLEALRSGARPLVEQMYRDYRTEFFGWLRKTHGCTTDQAADCYQQAFMILYENVLSGRLHTLTASLKTYLFAVGRNVARRQMGGPTVVAWDEQTAATRPDVGGWEEEEQLNERQQTVADQLQVLGEPCRTLLRLFYYEHRTMRQIATALGYKNEDVAKSQKVRCMKKLQANVLQNMQP